MTVGEVVDILNKVDRERTVYIPDQDGTAQPVAAVVDIKHVNLPIDGISISDDVGLLPASMMGDDTNDGL